MYYITELIGARTAPPNVCFATPRIFFAIYYQVADHAFKYAAETWVRVVKKQEYYIANHDEFYIKEVKSESEFKAAWNEVNAKALSRGGEVWAGNIFSHASKQDDSQDGLEFLSGVGNDGTLKKSEIDGLVKLPWSRFGYLILTGCNTGLVNERSWAPARAFAQRQGVPTLGQTGYAYFSTDWDTYKQKSPADKHICLWAYKRGKNGMFGDGKRMPGSVFTY